MSFLEKVQPYIASDDNALRNFALQVIDNSHLGNEDTFFIALEALDKLSPNALTNPILPYTNNIPVTEAMAEEILKRLNNKDANFSWYAKIIENFPTTLLEKYQPELNQFVNQEVVQNMVDLNNLDEDALIQRRKHIIHQLEEKGLNLQVFNHAKRIYHALNQYQRSEDIGKAIHSEVDNEFFSYHGILHIYLAGEEKIASLIPTLAGLMVRIEEDILMEEVITSLIKIGTDDVLKEVEKYMENTETAMAALEVIKSIKTPLAEEILLKYFDTTKDMTIKTLIAEALCEQLSVKAIPDIVALMEENYDQGQLDLTEVIYPNCVMNGINHPKLDTWKDMLAKEERKWETFRQEQILQSAKSQGINRNDPCICGSGKKFKKCCGA